MGRNSKSLAGERFDRLVVVKMVSRNRHGNSRWKCVCDCGNETEAFYQNLKQGYVKSCGCLGGKREAGKAK